MATKILLADDSVTIRKVVELTFSDTDVHVSSVGSGEEAIATFDDLRPDLVLADVVMPNGNGYDVCERVKASEHPVPVLLLTGTFEPFDDELAKACGADGHLVKPFESHALLERVERMLEEEGLRREAESAAREAEEAVAAAVREAEANRPVEVPVELPEARPVDIAPIPVAPSDIGRVIPVEVESASEPANTAPESASGLSEIDLERLSRAVARHLSEDVLREVAWDLVPELADRIIRERLDQLERDAERGPDSGS